MIRKVTTSIPFVFTPHIQARILYYVSKNMSLCIKSHEHTIHITSNNIELEYGDSKVDILCLHEWITVMNVLNNISSYEKRLILRVLDKFPNKLLSIINVVLLMGHYDIMNIILMMIFDGLKYEQTYDIYTYIDKNGMIEPLLCYSKLCGFEHDPHDMSKYLINYFDKTYNIYDHKSACEKAKDICGLKWLVDPEQQLYLINVSNSTQITGVARVEKSEVAMYVYFVNNNLSAPDLDKIYTPLELSHIESSSFYKFLMNELSVDHIRIRLHHNLINGKLY